MDLLLSILFTLAIIVSTIILYFKWRYTYWIKKNLPYLNPKFPFGTMENPFARTTSLAMCLKRNYDQLKAQGHNHGGLYNIARPSYLPVAPDYVKNIMQNDFEYFVDRGYYYNEKDDPISAHLFAIGGQKWRNLRRTLTPTFTTGKMKMMFKTLLTCSLPLQEAVDRLTKNEESLDIKEIAACFTTDVIVLCVCGLECNSFQGDGHFRKFGKKVFQRNKFQAIIGLLLFISNQDLGRFFRLKFLPRDTTDFIMKIVEDAVNYRETNNITRKDMLQILIDLKNSKDENNIQDGKTLTMEELAAQVFVFFAAGFETSSATISYCLFELSLHTQIQKKVRSEIYTVLKKHNEKITYEALKEMRYMSQVIKETLRKYPPGAYLTRTCVKDYKIPGTDTVLSEGTPVFIPVLGIHYDPEYYPDPERFDPERFAEQEEEQRLPFTYLAFGDGPRNCIGQRFAMMQVKLALIVFLKDYEVVLDAKTKIPLQVDSHRNFFATKGTIWLNTKRID